MSVECCPQVIIPYNNNFPNALALLAQLRSTNGAFSQFLKAREHCAVSESLDLAGLLILPVQAPATLCAPVRLAVLPLCVCPRACLVRSLVCVCLYLSFVWALQHVPRYQLHLDNIARQMPTPESSAASSVLRQALTVVRDIGCEVRAGLCARAPRALSDEQESASVFRLWFGRVGCA